MKQLHSLFDSSTLLAAQPAHRRERTAVLHGGMQRADAMSEAQIRLFCADRPSAAITTACDERPRRDRERMSVGCEVSRPEFGHDDPFMHSRCGPRLIHWPC